MRNENGIERKQNEKNRRWNESVCVRRAYHPNIVVDQKQHKQCNDIYHLYTSYEEKCR